MKLPFNLRKTVIINLKHYQISSGIHCEHFLSKFIGMDFPEDIRIIFALNPIDFHLAKNFPELEFYAQHVYPTDYGANTGMYSIESLMDFGITGSLLNHSEMRVQEEFISKVMNKSKTMDFPVVICAENNGEADKLSRLTPEFIAYEPPELIGGNMSVTSSKPEIIREVVTNCAKSSVPVLVGAGVKNNSDMRKSIELGANGVLVASGIVLAENPLVSLTSLIERL